MGIFESHEGFDLQEILLYLQEVCALVELESLGEERLLHVFSDSVNNMVDSEVVFVGTKRKQSIFGLV